MSLDLAPQPPAAAAVPERKRDAGLAAFGARRILGMRVDASSYERAVTAILEMAETGGGTTCVATVHMVMEAFDDPAYQRVVNAADLVTSDGMPLVWALRARGFPEAQRVYGPDLVPEVCAEAARRGVPVGFYGGSPEVLGALTRRLAVRFPGLRIAFAMSPPFRPLTPEEDAEVVADIRESGARILFVGLGCPKQERWMAEHRERLDCAQVGVGAAFDFLAGRKRQAPRWLQRAGLEWLFRLACEPRRLWRRYVWHNPRFAWRAGLETVRAARRDAADRVGERASSASSTLLVGSEDPPREHRAQRAPPRVTVLLPVFDAEDYLDEAVESILAQSYRDFELLAVDDGSRDASVALLEKHARRDPRVRIVRRRHEGVTATLNAGLELARGELVARMDADDVALPRRLELQVAMLDREPEIACVGGAYEVIDAKSRRISVVRPPCGSTDIEAAALEGRSPIIHSAALFRRDRVLSLGGYDARVPVAQDYDLWLRLMDVARLANLPDVVLRVRYTPRSVSGSRQAEQIEHVRRLCEAARARRGIPGPFALRNWRPVSGWRSRQHFALSWSRSAWRLGERRTALVYALRAAAIHPFSKQLLGTLGHELRRLAQRAVRAGAREGRGRA